MNLFNNSRSNGLPLYLFRIAFGIFLLLSSLSLIKKIFIRHIINFQEIYIPYFNFIPLPSYTASLILLWTLALLSIFFIIGYRFKLVSSLIFLISLYLFSIHMEKFNNHYYLVLLILMLFTVSDAGKGFSLTKEKAPESIPSWQLNLLRFQCALPYFFSGIQKLLDNDWRNGILIQGRINHLNFHSLFSQIDPTIIGSIVAKLAITFDIAIGFLLLHKKTRKWAAIPFLGFHLINHFIIFGKIAGRDSLGVFPHIAIASLIIFFDGDEISKGLSILKEKFNQFQLKLSNQVLTLQKSIFRPYIVSIILSIIILFPIYRYANYTQTYWKDLRIGTWNSHALKKTGFLDIYYQHNQTGEWILYIPRTNLFIPHYKALESPEGHYQLAQNIRSQMESTGLFVPYIGFISQITINGSKVKKFQGILPWEELTKQLFETEFTKSIPETKQ